MCYGTHLAMEIEDRNTFLRTRLAKPLDQCPVCHSQVVSGLPAKIEYYSTPEGTLVDVLVYHVECWRKEWQERQVNCATNTQTAIKSRFDEEIWCHWVEMGILEQLEVLEIVFMKKRGVAKTLAARICQIENPVILDPALWRIKHASRSSKSKLIEKLNKLKRSSEEYGRRRICATANHELVDIETVSALPILMVRGIIGFGEEFIDMSIQMLSMAKCTDAAIDAIYTKLAELEATS